MATYKTKKLVRSKKINIEIKELFSGDITQLIRLIITSDDTKGSVEIRLDDKNALFLAKGIITMIKSMRKFIR